MPPRNPNQFAKSIIDIADYRHWGEAWLRSHAREQGKDPPGCGASRQIKLTHDPAVEKSGLNDLREGAEVFFDIVANRGGKESAETMRDREDRPREASVNAALWLSESPFCLNLPSDGQRSSWAYRSFVPCSVICSRASVGHRECLPDRQSLRENRAKKHSHGKAKPAPEQAFWNVDLIKCPPA
jgi:hypothetical protein